jgi:hypothetical protein
LLDIMTVQPVWMRICPQAAARWCSQRSSQTV